MEAPDYADCSVCGRDSVAWGLTLDHKQRCHQCAPCAVCAACGHSYQRVDGPCPCHAEAAERAASRAPDPAAVRGTLATVLHAATATGYVHAGRCAQLSLALGCSDEGHYLAELDKARSLLDRELAALDTALAALRTARAHDSETRGPR